MSRESGSPLSDSLLPTTHSRILTHGSLFAGVGGFDLGFERAGFKTRWQVEIEPFCQAVLRSHARERQDKHRVALYADIRKCTGKNLKSVDVITAGFPCQDLSVAGKRRGLAGKRSGLFFHCARILNALHPPWFVIENVPGFLSSPPKAPGRDFAIALGKLTGFYPEIPAEGWQNAGVCVGPKRTVAWRVLDSQYFGVAQRRRRVFLVGGPGKSSAFAVLFEPDCVARDLAPSGQAGPDLAYSIAAGAGGSKFGSGRYNQDTFAIENRKSKIENRNVASPLSAGSSQETSPAGRRFESRFARNGRGAPSGICPPLKAESRQGDGSPLVAFNIIGGGQQGKNHAYQSKRTGAIQSKGNSASGNEAGTLVCPNSQLRTPNSAPFCSAPDSDRMRDSAGLSEGLDDSEEGGFENPPLLPEGLDSARYRALGNAVTVQVAEWIGKRIMNYER